MRKKFLILALVATGVLTLSFTAVPAASQATDVIEFVKSENAVIKQTLKFSDGSDDVVIYYKKDGDGYSAWSKTDLRKQDPKRLSLVEKTVIEKAEAVEGECYYEARSLDKVISDGGVLYGLYGKYINL